MTDTKAAREHATDNHPWDANDENMLESLRIDIEFWKSFVGKEWVCFPTGSDFANRAKNAEQEPRVLRKHYEDHPEIVKQAAEALAKLSTPRKPDIEAVIEAQTSLELKLVDGTLHYRYVKNIEEAVAGKEQMLKNLEDFKTQQLL